jgi:hypothetical protein
MIKRDQREILILPGSVAWFPALSVTLMVNVNLPAAVGVPPIAILDHRYFRVIRPLTPHSAFRLLPADIP